MDFDITQIVEMKTASVQGDYVKNGLIYCYKCNTPKQCKIVFLGDEAIVSCMCRCESEASEAEQKEFEEMQRNFNIQGLRKRGITNSKYLKMTFRNNRCNLDFAKKYVSEWDFMRDNGQGLVLCGDTGVGKTFAACCIANALIDREISACVINLPTALARLFNREYQNELYQKISNSGLCVFDDLGANRDTEYSLEQLYVLIDMRYETGRPMIITTNLNTDQLRLARQGMWIDGSKNYQYKRIFDRICGACIPYTILGESLRVKARQNVSDEATRRLGI